jgi:hypothetical protein
MPPKVLKVVGRTVGGLALITGLAYGVYTHRPQPPTIKKEIFKGVTYERVVLTSPRPMVAHIVTVNLQESQARFFTTPPTPGLKYPYKAEPVSEFLRQNKLQLAINADFFKPYWGEGPWNYYPHKGDPVFSRGLSIHQGKVITPVESHRPSIYFSEDGQVSFNPTFKPFDAISGESVFLRDGKWVIKEPDRSYWRTSVQPRNCIGLSKDGMSLMIVVIDGRQPGYSEGATVKELATIAAAHGAGTMLDLDGGGSETLVQEGKAGDPELLNCPIDSWIPNRERPVGNQLGMYLKRI